MSKTVTEDAAQQKMAAVRQHGHGGGNGARRGAGTRDMARVCARALSSISFGYGEVIFAVISSAFRWRRCMTRWLACCSSGLW